MVGSDTKGDLIFYSVLSSEVLITVPNDFRNISIYPLYNNQIFIIKDHESGSLARIVNPYYIRDTDKIYWPDRMLP